jgi:hypothetical protein
MREGEADGIEGGESDSMRNGFFWRVHEEDD